MILDKIPKPLPFRTQEEIMSEWLQTSGPVVSILCATFNHVDFIEDAILGFLGQVTDFSFEVIIRDDASTDGTAEVVRTYAASHPKIIQPIFEEKNTYPGKKPLACMMGVASGKYIALCEGDDYWIDEHKIFKQVEILDASPTIFLVETKSVIVDGSRALRVKKQGGTRTYLYRRFDDYPLHRQRYIYFGDTFITNRLRADGDTFNLDVVTAVCRKHPGGVWSSIVESDERLLEFRRSMTQFWLTEYFIDRHDRERGALHLSRTIEYTLRAFPEIKARTKIALVVEWSILGRLKILIRALKNKLRPLYKKLRREG